MKCLTLSGTKETMAALDIVKHFVTEQNEYFRDNLRNLIPECLKLTTNPDSMVRFFFSIEICRHVTFLTHHFPFLLLFFDFTEHSHYGCKCFGHHRQLSSICYFTTCPGCSVWAAAGVRRSQTIGTKCGCFSKKQMVFGWNGSIKTIPNTQRRVKVHEELGRERPYAIHIVIC